MLPEFRGVLGWRVGLDKGDGYDYTNASNDTLVKFGKDKLEPWLVGWTFSHLPRMLKPNKLVVGELVPGGVEGCAAYL